MSDPDSLSQDEWGEVHSQTLRDLARTNSAEGVFALGELVFGFPPEPHHKEMVRVILEAIYTRTDTLILMPAGSAKTTWGNTIFLTWLIAMFPDIRVGLFSQTSDFAAAFSQAIMRTFEENEEFRSIFGDLTNGGKWTATGWHRKGSRWAQSKDFTLFAGGAGGQVASKRFDVLLCDDILGADNTGTLDQREKIKQWYDQSLEPRVLGSGVRIVFGTRWGEGDLYQTLGTPVAEGGYGFRVHTIRALIEDPGPDGPVLDEDGDLLFNRLHGFRSYWESQWSVEFLLNKRAKNPSIFDCVYQQDITGMLSGDIFQKHWFQYYGTKAGDPVAELPPGRSYTKRMGVDLASSTKSRADFTARTSTAEDEEGNFFVMRSFRDKIGVGHADFIAEGYDDIPVGIVYCEKNAFQSTVIQEVLRDYPQIPIDGIETDTDKRTRAIALAAKYKGGKVWHHESLRAGDLEREQLAYPKQHDDMIDSDGFSMGLGGAGSFFFGKMSGSSIRAVKAGLMEKYGLRGAFTGGRFNN